MLFSVLVHGPACYNRDARGHEHTKSPQMGLSRKAFLGRCPLQEMLVPSQAGGSPSVLHAGTLFIVQTVYVQILARCRTIKVQQKIFS